MRSGSEDFSVEVDRRDGVYGIRVRGDLDLASSPRLSTAIADGIRMQSDPIVVDLGETTFIDSTGLSVLLNGVRRLTRQSRRLAVVWPRHPGARRPFEVTRLAGTIPLYESWSEAVTAAARP